MEPDLVIFTQADYELYEHLNAACYSLYRKKNAYVFMILSTLCLGWYLGFGAYQVQNMFYLWVITPLCMAFFIILSLWIIRTSSVAKRAAKRSIKRAPNASLCVQYAFFPRHMTGMTPTSSLSTEYTGIRALAETSKFYMIFTNKSSAHCIRKRDLGPSNVELFRTYMQDKTNLVFRQIKY